MAASLPSSTEIFRKTAKYQERGKKKFEITSQASSTLLKTDPGRLWSHLSSDSLLQLLNVDHIADTIQIERLRERDGKTFFFQPGHEAINSMNSQPASVVKATGSGLTDMGLLKIIHFSLSDLEIEAGSLSLSLSLQHIHPINEAFIYRCSYNTPRYMNMTHRGPFKSQVLYTYHLTAPGSV